MSTQRPVSSGSAPGRSRWRGQAQGLAWLSVALVVIVGVVGAVVWWLVHPRSADPTGYALKHSCPPLLRGFPSGVDDYVDAFQWSGLTYVVIPHRVVAMNALGPQVTTIDCSVDELRARTHQRVEPGAPWPDRTSTYIPSGTAVYRLDQVPQTCQLAVRVDGRVKVYQPMEPAQRQC